MILLVVEPTLFLSGIFNSASQQLSQGYNSTSHHLQANGTFNSCVIKVSYLFSVSAKLKPQNIDSFYSEKIWFILLWYVQSACSPPCSDPQPLANVLSISVNGRMACDKFLWGEVVYLLFILNGKEINRTCSIWTLNGLIPFLKEWLHEHILLQFFIFPRVHIFNLYKKT